MEEALEAVKNATNEQDLANRFKEFGKEMVKLNYVAARRQQVGKVSEMLGECTCELRNLAALLAWTAGQLHLLAIQLATASGPGIPPNGSCLGQV